MGGETAVPAGFAACEACAGKGYFENEKGFWESTCIACKGEPLTALPYATEAELVADFLAQLSENQRREWTAYPETAGWDLLLVKSSGEQLGIEAKLSLNAKVIDQSLSGSAEHWQSGPDFRAVLVPADKCQAHLARICSAIGVAIITVRRADFRVGRWHQLPEELTYGHKWANWLPEKRCPVPAYVPDVKAGHASPVALTPWKIKAIKLMVLLDRNGAVHRSDMSALGISPTRWTDRFNGFLAATPNGYVRHAATPDYRKQHPRNYAEIEADFAQWNPYRDLAA